MRWSRSLILIRLLVNIASCFCVRSLFGVAGGILVEFLGCHVGAASLGWWLPFYGWVVNPLTRLAHWLGRYPWLMKLAPVIVPVDRVLHRVSGNRLSLVRFAGLPSLRLVTVGRKSGLLRANDLLYTPYGDCYVVIGSGWGRAQHPTWTLNLTANPEATIIVRGRSIPVVARRVEDGVELDAIWELALRNWPGYVMEKRLAGREFRVFVLSERR